MQKTTSPLGTTSILEITGWLFIHVAESEAKSTIKTMFRVPPLGAQGDIDT